MVMSDSEERVNWKFAHKYKENLILDILYKWRVNYVHSCFAYAHTVFLFPLMDKSKSKSKRFSHIAFHLLHSEIEIPNTASACCHIAFHYLHLKIEIPNTASACCHNAFHLLHSEFWLRSREMEKRWTANQNIKWPSDFIQNNIESRLYN